MVNVLLYRKVDKSHYAVEDYVRQQDVLALSEFISSENSGRISLHGGCNHT